MTPAKYTFVYAPIFIFHRPYFFPADNNIDKQYRICTFEST